MRIISSIPPNYLEAVITIEQRSNPYPWTDENLRSAYLNFAHLGVFEGTQLIAFVFYQTVVDEAEIIHLVCDKAFQGLGYARQLMSALHEQLIQEKVNQLFLEVRETNQSAQQLYQRLGFQMVGRRQAYYHNREDALLMRINLTNRVSI